MKKNPRAKEKIVRLISANGCFRLQARLLADFRVRGSTPLDFLKGAASSKYISGTRKERAGGMAVLAKAGPRVTRTRGPYSLSFKRMESAGKTVALTATDYGYPPRGLVTGLDESERRGAGHYYLFQLKKIPQGMYFDEGEREAVLGWVSAPLLKSIPKSKSTKVTGVFAVSEGGLQLRPSKLKKKMSMLQVTREKQTIWYTIRSGYAQSIRKSMRLKGRGRPYLYLCRGKFGGIIWENEM